MAAPFAYEQPTINNAWDGFLKHLPTIALIWVVTFIINVMGIALGWLVSHLGTSYFDDRILLILNQLSQFPFTLVSSFIGVLFVAVPATYYETGRVISLEEAFRILFQRPWRYLLAGLLFALLMTAGLLLCIIPGIAVALVMPVYINKVFNGDQGIVDALTASFQAVYRHPNSMSFILVEVLAWLLVIVVSIATCLIGGLLAGPIATFYIQNAAYRLGILS